jgi:hypothetical protein
MNKLHMSNEGVIQASTIREADEYTVAYRYVIRRNPHNSNEFVVHMQTQTGFHNGLYTDDLEVAAADLKQRAEAIGLTIDNNERCIGFDVVTVDEVVEYETDKEYSLGEDGNCDTHCNWS